MMARAFETKTTLSYDLPAKKLTAYVPKSLNEQATADSLLRNPSFEELGLVAFNPDNLDWWSNSDRACP